MSVRPIDRSPNRLEVVAGNLRRYLESARPADHMLRPGEPLRPGSKLTARKAVELFEDQAACRALDVVARELKRDGKTFYTISSAGHEQNVALGALLRTDDPCFLHYRSGALMMARARRVPGETPVFDTLLGLVASADDPIAGGRHKVWGSRRLWVPPQTSTIASHLPKAVGAAFALSRAKRMGAELPLPGDAIVCCSFGDASTNHATALAGINSARYAYRGGRPTPILFVCEDNRIGISVDTPRGWVRERFASMKHVAYFEAGGEIDEIYDVTREAIQTCRSTRGPVFLHVDCVRLFGHAGSDIEAAYRSWEEIAAIEGLDPLLVNARRLVEQGAATPDELQSIMIETHTRVRQAAEEAASRPKLTTLAEVVAPLAPYDESAVRADGDRPADPQRRSLSFEGKLPEQASTPGRRTMAAHLNAALADELLRRPEMIVFGEDVGRKGGVYGVTAHLQRRFGRARVFDTLLDETTILGVGQGAAHVGLLPVPEIQYLAYVHNAVDQLRGEACSLSFFSSGEFTNPMVVRVAGFGYQKGFGGHFHNDCSIGNLRDIPGIVIATPSRGDDAARLLRGCLAMAKACGRVVVFVEPIALYHERDLYEEDDGEWLCDYPAPPLADGGESAGAILPGEVGVYHPEATDLLIPSYANGLRLSLRAARRLEHDHGIRARVIDLRWLEPLPFEAIERHARECAAVLVADEGRSSGGGVAEALIAFLAELGFRGPLGSVRSADSYVPLGPAADVVLLSEDDIVNAARELRGVKRIALVCPGRGSYTENTMGSLPRDHPWVRRADELRAEYMLPTLSELDHAEAFDRKLHLRAVNVSALIWLVALLDAREAALEDQMVCVCGNSMGWYIALAVGGALDFDDGFRLMQEMALIQEERLGGGQLIYPVVGDDWRPDPERRAAIDAALESAGGEAFRSIDLGGYAVLAGSDAGMSHLMRALPPVQLGRNRYPFKLIGHGPYHTPLLSMVSERAGSRLGRLDWKRPTTTLIDGRGARFTPWSTDVRSLADYTLGHQIVEPFEFTTSVRTALREHAPDELVLPGPGNTLGAVCGQILIAEGWRNVRSREDFDAAQASEQAPIRSMGR